MKFLYRGGFNLAFVVKTVLLCLDMFCVPASNPVRLYG